MLNNQKEVQNRASSYGG